MSTNYEVMFEFNVRKRCEAESSLSSVTFERKLDELSPM